MNNYPILAPTNTWFAPNVSSVTKASITEIEIMDSYTPDSSVTVVDSWDASAAKDGSITCYVIGTKLIIAGNGSGKIAANEDSSALFFAFSNITEIIRLTLLDTTNVKSMRFMFTSCEKIISLDLSTWNVTNVENLSMIFAEMSSITDINISTWDFKNIIDTSQVFRKCKKLVNLSMPTYVKLGSSANGMFHTCSSLAQLDVSEWDVSQVTDMTYMFYSCTALKEIDVSKWDVSKVTLFDHFAAHANLKRKGIENWKTTSATNMNAMFHNCAEEELDLSGFDTSKVQFFDQMFENSPNLKRIKGLENWDTSNGIGFTEMFGRCYALEELNFSSFDTSKAKNGVSVSLTNNHKSATLNNFINDCRNLKKVTLGPNFSINGDGTNTAAANMLILPTPSTDYIEGADGMWYTFNGDAYAPNAVKDRTYNIYYASKNLIHNLSVRVNNGTILDIVEAIREKVPNLEPTLLSDLDDIIRNI